jgi:hypothetical protein
LFAVVQLVSFLHSVEDLLGHTGKVEGPVGSVAGARPSPSVTTVARALGKEGVADSSQSEENNDCSKSKEKSSTKIERKSGIGVSIRVMAGIRVVMILLRISTSSSSFILDSRSFHLSISPNSGQKEESKREGESDLSHHLD